MALLAGAGATARAENVVTTTFDELSPATLVTSLDGIDFTFAPHDPLDAGFPLLVSNAFATLSAGNFLGVQNGTGEFFRPGDAVDLEFAAPRRALEVVFVAHPGTPNGAFGIEAGLNLSLSSRNRMLVLPTGDEAFAIRFEPSVPFSTVALLSDPALSPAFSIDQIVTTDTCGACPFLFADGFEHGTLFWSTTTP